MGTERAKAVSGHDQLRVWGAVWGMGLGSGVECECGAKMPIKRLTLGEAKRAHRAHKLAILKAREEQGDGK